MKYERWSCPKCGEKNYDVGEIRVTVSFWSKLFNVQNNRYRSVTCEKCCCTEFYRNQSSS
ncbi:MAG: GTP-binding protein, partial [Rickettsiales bacterium]|nr:GTP-binding protein [Rickettsiales bacterium]